MRASIKHGKAGVYIDNAHRPGVRFRWVKAPTNDGLSQLAHTIAKLIARYLHAIDYLISIALGKSPKNTKHI